MMITKLASALCLAFTFLHSAMVQAQQDQFEAREIHAIRNVSQAILKVRGQRRHEVIIETQPLRDEIRQVREFLKQAATSDKGNFTINQKTVSTSPVSLTQQSASTSERLRNWLRSWTMRFSRDEIKQNDDPVSAELTSLERAKSIIKKRKAVIEKEQPAFWQLGKHRDEKQTNIRQALATLENEINEVGNAVGAARLQALIKRLDATYSADEPKQPNVPEPTITSITKHYRK